MPVLISIVGRSRSGKTTLMERLIPELKKRGYRVAAAKHSAHGFDLDYEGKDSSRLVKAGSDAMALVAPNQLALLYNQPGELGLDRFPRFLVGDFDLLLVEGFRREKATKIETHLAQLGPELLCEPSELWAVVSDEPLNLPVPCFSWDDISGLANLMEKTFPLSREEELELFVNGAKVRTGPFVTEFMGKTLAGMVSGLKGVGKIRSLDIRWRRGNKE